MFNYRFYSRRQAFDRVCESAKVKGYGPKRLCKMFPERQQNINEVKKLLKKIDKTGTIDR